MSQSDEGSTKGGRKTTKQDDVLSGTTLRVYRFMFKEARPVGPHEIQRSLDLSSASIAHYHLKKLLEAGLVKEVPEGYVVDKIVFENMIRVRRLLIPFQTTYFIFFCTTIVMLVILVRPTTSNLSVYLFALMINAAAIGIFGHGILKALKTDFH